MYFPDRAVPSAAGRRYRMPDRSLTKPRERLVMSALMEFDAAGNMQSAPDDLGRDSFG